MAKLGAYYGLCPLIDHRSLLGIAKETNGVVIVTLGKNIAVKYKLSDQKQLHSWRTKEKFSSSIIYDKEQSRYVAVFNENLLRFWSGNEEFIDKLKKYKFNQQIQTIFTCNDRSFVVFKNGAVFVLKDAVEKRKELAIESVIDLDSEFIYEVLYANFNNCVYVGLVVKTTDNYTLYWTKFVGDTQDGFYKIFITREKADLTGYVFHVDKFSVNFLSMWSDGRVYSVELKETDLDSSDIGELFTVIESISCKEYVSLVSLDPNYIAMYGCNSNEEGALLVIYNVQFKVVQSKQSFKLFTNGAKLYCIDGNLFFPVGQNLAVLPFHLDMEQLAALVGSHKVVQTDPDISIVQKVQFVSWGKNPDLNVNNVPDKIKSKVEDFESQGLSDNFIFEALLADVLEGKNLDTLIEMVDYFADVPESCLVKVLKLLINLESKLFKKNTQSAASNFPPSLQPRERTELLDVILTKSFNETLLLSHLRSILSLDEVLVLLQYIHFLLSENGHCLPSHNFMETEAKLIEWSCILLDANYQKFLLSRDAKISETLTSLKNQIKEELESYDDLQQLAALLTEIKNNRPIQKTIHMGGMDYSIGEFPLY
ncbi:nucleolar protein 11 [Tribolium madens]|uniref:nucleolar protein 11 n=1 Tax=Tribolium madens TaxID=41895 RepID=UPI001CF747B5|nr:nucleolar protein 11 [Tribolium madens]